MEDDQQFCLRWNNHQSTLVSVFDTLLEKGIHVDCTLGAEGQTLKAHKVVLSACSPYFESVLSQNYDKHPIIILKDVKYAELRAMMDYMYRGEVNISQDQLAALLKAAESLQIKGLSDNKPSRPPSRPAPTAHPPRAPSPPPKIRDGSIDSREGSVSPTRRRKKARRNSTDVATAPLLPQPTTDSAAGNGDDHCKKEEGMEDLTLDEEHDEPAVTHNDVVRSKLISQKWKNIRDAWMKCDKKIRESKSGSGAKPVHKYQYYDNLQFLKKITPQPTQSGSNMPEENKSEVTNVNKRKKNEELNPVDKKMIKFMETLEKDDDSRMMSFFKGIAPTVERFKDEDIVEFQYQVLNIIRNIQYKNSYSAPHHSRTAGAMDTPAHYGYHTTAGPSTRVQSQANYSNENDSLQSIPSPSTSSLIDFDFSTLHQNN